MTPDHPENQPGATPIEVETYTVSRLNAEARLLLEAGFPLLWVEGELSNVARPSSGHLYFSLKDPEAQVRCAMFRNRNQHLGFRPTDGMQVRARARVSLYEARGEYQLIVEHLEEAGHGALQRAFEALKRRLSAEGLFAAEAKQPIPSFPRRVGVITSPTGAAVRDILSVLKRRFPSLPILLYPVPVQGDGAAEAIAHAIRLASERRDCDVLILARGGGSLEDLWAFNEEGVARAIRDCTIPIVSGVGHEVDFTITDFAADARAPTPSAAAELVSPDAAELVATYRRIEGDLIALLRQRLSEQAQRLAWLEGRLAQRHPAQRLLQHSQRLDELEGRLALTMRRRLETTTQRVSHGITRLRAANPARLTERLAEREQHLRQQLYRALERRLGNWRARLEVAARGLHALSPLATLGRGYAIVQRERDGTILRRADAVVPTEQISARLARGTLICRVIESVDGEEEG